MAHILVIGGGAAGMVAAWRAALAGHRVTLLEANARLGVKLRISGGGKCNITHGGTLKEVLAAFPASQARFLRHAFHAFTNDEVVELLRRQGVESYVRDNGRVFPLDRPGSAAAVVAAFQELVERAGVEVRFGARVTGLRGAAPKLEGVELEGRGLRADAVILATGGASYPETGTRGEVARWLAELGVPVHPWAPALAPIPLADASPAWEGVAFRGGRLRLLAGREGRRLAEFPGDIVFTRAGISGPAALELSRDTEIQRRRGTAWLTYDFLGQDEARIEALLQEEQRRNPHLAARNWLQTWIPERVAESLWREHRLGDLRMKALPKALRRSLATWVAAFPLGEARTVPLERGEVAAGGVALEAVDPRTMRVQGWDNLHVCGELLDVDGPVGGYNLQAAFSTGFVAGDAV